MAIRGFLPMLMVCLALMLSGCEEPGAAGVDGRDGADGADAAASQDGTDGADGEYGEDGQDGADGANGTNASANDPFSVPQDPAADSQPAENAARIALSPENTTITFVGTKDSGKHDGGFRELAGTLVLNGNAVQSISMVVPTNSLWSDNDKLTAHLKSRDFFEVSAHPEFSFVAQRIEPAEGGEATHTITGDLTMLGETHAINAPATIQVSADKVNLTSSFTIDRTQWGMEYGQGQVHNDVQVSVQIDATRTSQ